MPERSRRTETMCIGAPIRVGAVTLLPIERVVLRAIRVSDGAWFVASKDPHALVVRDVDGIRTLGFGNAAESLETLREAVPGLDAALAAT
jgi:uncharacterized spore protein YtfJ